MAGYFNILTVISLILNVVSGNVILSSPINIAVTEGKVAQFECQANAEISSWSFTPVGSSVSINFYHRVRGRMSYITSFYGSTSPDGRVSIKTDSVRLEDAGIYECSIQQPKGNETTLEQRNAQLIVLASEPKCWRNESDDRFRCSVDYRGNWAPLMEWRRDGPGESEVTGGLQYVVTNNQSFSSILFVGGEETSVSIASFICRISFSFNGSSTGTAANNVPKYTPICPDSDKSSTSRVSSTGDDRASDTGATNSVENKDDVSLVTFVVSLASVIITVLILLIVYHIFLKKFVLGRGNVANDTDIHRALSTIDPAQGSEYAVIPESLGLQGPDSSTLPSMQGTINSVDSSAYIELVATDDWRQRQQQVYLKLQTVPEEASIDDIQEDIQTHSYVNFPVNH